MFLAIEIWKDLNGYKRLPRKLKKKKNKKLYQRNEKH